MATCTAAAASAVLYSSQPHSPPSKSNAMEIPNGRSDESLLAALGEYHSKVDTSRPFRSVKEAVVIFGERFLTGDIYSTPRSCAHSPAPRHEPLKLEPSPICATEKPNHNKRTDDGTSGNNSDPRGIVAEALGRLQEEVEETKRELKLLKERESVTEVALASLNAELHRNMSKLAKAEAARSSSAVLDTDVCVQAKVSKTLDQILRDDEPESEADKIYFGGVEEGKMKKKKKKKKTKKKEPITPLVVVDCLFSRRKGRSSTPARDLNSTLYSPPKVHFA